MISGERQEVEDLRCLTERANDDFPITQLAEPGTPAGVPSGLHEDSEFKGSNSRLMKQGASVDVSVGRVSPDIWQLVSAKVLRASFHSSKVCSAFRIRRPVGDDDSSFHAGRGD